MSGCLLKVVDSFWHYADACIEVAKGGNKLKSCKRFKQQLTSPYSVNECLLRVFSLSGMVVQKTSLVRESQGSRLHMHVLSYVGYSQIISVEIIVRSM